MNVDNESSLQKLFLESSLNNNIFMIATTVDTGN